MGQVVEDILRIDWEQVRFKRAASGLIAMVIVLAFLGIVDDVILAAVMAALFVTATGGDGSMRERLPGMVGFTLVGALFGGLTYWSADSVLTVAVVLGLATYVGTLAAGFGPVAAQAGLFLTIWPLFALMLGSADAEPWTVAAAFAIGGGLAIALTAIRLTLGHEDRAGVLDEAEDRAERTGVASAMSDPWQVVVGPIGQFAALRCVAIALSVVVGFLWFPTYPLWAAITVIVVVKPSTGQSVSVAVQRTLGTGVGVAAAVLVAQVLPRSDAAVALAFLISGFFMIVFNNANYTLFATFLTAMLIFGQRLAHADAFEAGWTRLLATVVGALIALGVIAIATRIGSNDRRSTP